MNLLLADDHHILRRGLVEICKSIDGITNIFEAKDGFETIELLKNNSINILILDISMPGKDGFEILYELQILKSKVKVLVLSIYPEILFAVRALKAGALGYLNKNSAPEELEIALNTINKGQRYLSKSLQKQLNNQIGNSKLEHPHEKLTDREIQVFRLIVEGKTSEEISDDLCLSNKTISTHKVNILKKMNLQNNAQLVIYAIKNELLF